MQNPIYYSQSNQDKWVLKNFFQNMTYGYFLDIGAGNGIDLSNTYTMESQYFWDGICVEPHSVSYELLKKNRKCKTSNTFVSKDGEWVDYVEYSDEGVHQDYFSSSKEYVKFKHDVKTSIKQLQAKSLYSILKENQSASMIHYMSLDVEGSEFNILNNFFSLCKLENSTYRILSLSVEHNFIESNRKDIRKLLELNNYIYIKELEQDDLYVHTALYQNL